MKQLENRLRENSNMINNKTIRNCQIPFAPTSLPLAKTLGRIRLKNIYPKWSGENILQINEKHRNNPYALRIGTPITDGKLQQDQIYFILDYLAYNPVTNEVEKRDIVANRMMKKLYIGQSPDEATYSDYEVFINGNLVVDDIYLKKHDSIKNIPIGQLLTKLLKKVDKQSLEIEALKAEAKNKHIYTK